MSMAKKKASEVNKVKQEQLQKRFTAYLEGLKALNTEHGFQPVAVTQFSPEKGLYPWLTFEQYVTPQKPKESKADGQGDSNN